MSVSDLHKPGDPSRSKNPPNEVQGTQDVLILFQTLSTLSYIYIYVYIYT